MEIKMDSLTGIATKALDILFLNNPVRTSMGVLIGVVLWAFSPVFSPAFRRLAGLDFSKVPWIGWIAFGVLGVSLKSSPIKTRLPEDVEMLLDLLDKADEAGISKVEKRQHYRRILEKYADNVALNQKTQREIGEIEERLGDD